MTLDVFSDITFHADEVKEGHRLRVVEERVLRRMYGPKREEVGDGWIEVCIKELYGPYFGSDQEG